MKQFLLTILFTFVLVNASKAQQVTHIVHANEYLQRQVNSILSHNIKGLNAINGQVIIMDCKSGEIKAMVNLMNTKSGIKPAIRQLSEPTALMRRQAYSKAFCYHRTSLPIWQLSKHLVRSMPNSIK